MATDAQGCQSKFEPDKAQYSTPNFFTGCCFLWERIETQNLGKAQALGALPAMAALMFNWLILIQHLNFDSLISMMLKKSSLIFKFVKLYQQ